MGCWNGTDLFTQMPILCGEKIKLIILVQDESYATGLNGFCYSDDYMKPLSLPISGEYDDYGSIENIEEDKNTDTTLKHFSENGIIEEGDSSTIEGLCKAIERGKVKVKIHGEDKNVWFCTILEGVYKDVIKYTKNYTEYDGGTTGERCKRQVDSYFNSLKHRILKPGATEKEIEEHVHASFARSPLGDHTGSTFIKYDDSSLVRKLFTDISLLNNFMVSTRKSWNVQCGAGSQNQDYEYYNMLANTTKKLCNRKLKEMEEY